MSLQRLWPHTEGLHGSTSDGVPVRREESGHKIPPLTKKRFATDNFWKAEGQLLSPMEYFRTYQPHPRAGPRSRRSCPTWNRLHALFDLFCFGSFGPIDFCFCGLFSFLRERERQNIRQRKCQLGVGREVLREGGIIREKIKQKYALAMYFWGITLESIKQVQSRAYPYYF